MNSSSQNKPIFSWVILEGRATNLLVMFHHPRRSFCLFFIPNTFVCAIDFKLIIHVISTNCDPIRLPWFVTSPHLSVHGWVLASRNFAGFISASRSWQPSVVLLQGITCYVGSLYIPLEIPEPEMIMHSGGVHRSPNSIFANLEGAKRYDILGTGTARKKNTPNLCSSSPFGGVSCLAREWCHSLANGRDIYLSKIWTSLHLIFILVEEFSFDNIFRIRILYLKNI